MDITIQVIQVVLIAIVALIMVRLAFKRVTVFEYERGLAYVEGKFSKVLTPGSHWYLAYRSSISKVDIRPQFASIAGQEILSADSISLKVSLAARYQIVDPYAAVNKVEDYRQALHIELQLALREIVGSLSIDDLLAKRGEIGARLSELTEAKIADMGLRLISVNIKDIMFPGEIKKIFANVVKAQKEGLAALERARAESAALRNLANAARMIEGNPALMQLRLLQAVGESSGNTVVLDMSSHARAGAVAEGN